MSARSAMSELADKAVRAPSEGTWKLSFVVRCLGFRSRRTLPPDVDFAGIRLWRSRGAAAIGHVLFQDFRQSFDHFRVLVLHIRRFAEVVGEIIKHLLGRRFQVRRLGVFGVR